MTTVDVQRAKKILDDTRELFITTHWVQGDWTGYDEDADKWLYCAVGGLRNSVGAEPGGGVPYDDDCCYVDADYAAAVAALCHAIAEDDRYGVQASKALGEYREYVLTHETPPPEHRIENLEAPVINWNDFEGRTRDDVVAVFAAAITYLEGEAQ